MFNLSFFQKRIPYSQLVIATGCSGPFPGKCPPDMKSRDLIQLYEQYTDELKRAKSIVVVGGGAVGVEMAGEIATDYPDQKTVRALLILFISSVSSPNSYYKLTKFSPSLHAERCLFSHKLINLKAN